MALSVMTEQLAYAQAFFFEFCFKHTTKLIAKFIALGALV